VSVSNAWLLEPNDLLSIAIGDHEMVEYLDSSTCFPVPGAPNYCNQVLYWKNKLVPVMDLGVLLRKPVQGSGAFMSLIAYQQQPGLALQYLALKVRTTPEKILVDDTQVCELPVEINEGPLMPLCLTCFRHEDRPIVILDIASLCSAEFRDVVNVPGDLEDEQSGFYGVNAI
jgi:chemotaxis signal transduction protein